MVGRMLVGATLVALVAGCGGESGGGSAATPASTEDPRAGYFDATESGALNPLLASYSKASQSYDAQACNEEAQRLFRQGASPRRSVRCHLVANRALAGTLDGVRAELGNLDGDYRPECEAAVDEFDKALAEAAEARRRTLADWETYAKSGQNPKNLDRDSKAADERGQQLFAQDIVTLSKACYTAADLEEAGTQTTGGG